MKTDIATRLSENGHGGGKMSTLHKQFLTSAQCNWFRYVSPTLGDNADTNSVLLGNVALKAIWGQLFIVLSCSAG